MKGTHLLLIYSLLVGCATHDRSKYQTFKKHEGYQSNDLQSGLKVVTFIGNQYTNPSDAEMFAKFRAFEKSIYALLLFSQELDRRCRQFGVDLKSIAVAPAGKLFFRILPKEARRRSVIPFLFAATSLEARSGILYDSRPLEKTLSPKVISRQDGAFLWRESERLTGVKFAVQLSKSIGLH